MPTEWEFPSNIDSFEIPLPAEYSGSDSEYVSVNLDAGSVRQYTSADGYAMTGARYNITSVPSGAADSEFTFVVNRNSFVDRPELIPRVIKGLAFARAQKQIQETIYPGSSKHDGIFWPYSQAMLDDADGSNRPRGMWNTIRVMDYTELALTTVGVGGYF